MKEKTKIRQSNFELMRIISMIMIVMWHLIFHSVLFDQATGVTKFVLELLVLVGTVHVNSFILLTGYFQSDKDFSLKKFLSIIKTVWFYKVIILFFILFMGIRVTTKLEIFKELLPIDTRDYWFINVYLVLYILSPYLNILINKMTQQQYRKLLIISFILFSVLPILTNNATVSNNGYTVINFCFLYFIGGYLRKYPIENNFHFRNYSTNKIQFIFFIILIFSLMMNFIIYQFSKQLILMNNALLNELGNNFIINYRSYSNPIVLIQSISYFIYFGTLTLKSNVINKIGKNVVDVYLIHENYYISSVLYTWIGVSKWLNYSGYAIIALTILVPIIIFAVCILISFIKGLFCNFLESRKIYRKVSNIFYNYIEKF